jgi:hypothetical protein
LPDSPNETTVSFDEDIDLEELADTPLPLLATINKEYVRVEAIDTVNKTITLKRGAVDTQPQAHASGCSVVFLQTFQNLVRDGYTSGIDILVRLQTVGVTGILPIELVPTDSVSFSNRAIRPFPPQNVQVNGAYNRVIANWTGNLAFTWAHRDRLQATGAQASHYTQASFGPEPGTSYEITVDYYNSSDTLIGSGTTLTTTGTSLTVNTSSYTLPTNTAYVIVTLTSVRDGFKALYPFVARHDVP